LQWLPGDLTCENDARLRVDPVPLAFERVRWETDAPSLLSGEELRLVQLDAAHPEPPQSGFEMRNFGGLSSGRLQRRRNRDRL
jgi:hypothetical protein